MPPAPTQRIGYIDAMRGFAMLMVVYVHIPLFCYGPLDQLTAAGGHLLMFRDLARLFAMPLFFFISGFVLYKSQVVWSMAAATRFVARKALALLLPTAIFLSLYLVVNDQPFVTIFDTYHRKGYWFTIALFKYYLLYALFRYLSQRFGHSEGNGWILLIGSVLLYFAVTPMVLSRMGMSDKIMAISGLQQFEYFPCFAIGTLARKHFTQFIHFIENSKLMALLIVTFMAMFFLEHMQGLSFPGQLAMYLWWLVTYTLSLILVFAVFYKYQAAFQPTTHVGRTLQCIGRHTLAIYLLHYFFLPHNMQFIGHFLATYPNPIIELAISLLIAALVIAISLLARAVIGTSPLLEKYLGMK